MAGENPGLSPPLLADVLNQLATRERIALVNHLHDSLEHVRVVAEGACGLEASPPLTLQQVGDHLQAALRHLERAADVLGLQLEGPGAADAQRG